MKRLVIFDLDGTLLDTIADLAAATNHALAQLNFPTHEVSAIRTFVGNGIAKLLERAMPEKERKEENAARIRHLFQTYYDKHSMDNTKPYPGIIELLHALQQNGVMQAVASNKYQAATAQLVTHFFPDIHFVGVLGQRQNIPTKPDPSIVFELMKLANADKKDVLYVGDSGVDMQTALNAGVNAIGVSWGFRSRKELGAFRPMSIIEKPENLIEYL